MFEFCVRWFAWGLDTSIKALLVALVAAALLKLLRFRDSNIRHRVWTGVLAGMLALPVLTPLMPALRLPLVPSPDWLVAWAAESTSPAANLFSSEQVAGDFAAPPRLAIDPPSPNFPLDPIIDRHWQPSPQTIPTSRDFSAPADANDPPPAAGEFAESVSEPLAPAPAAPATARSWGQRLRAALPIFVLIAGGTWLFVSAFLGLRLAIGLALAAHLRRKSIAIDRADLPHGCSAGGLIRESSGICVPLTV